MVQECSRYDSELMVFAGTIYAEARGEEEIGMRAVAHVIKNRADANKAHWGGQSLKGVCLQKWQFECWNKEDSFKIYEPELFNQAKRIASEVMSGSSRDPTNGCNHYYAHGKIPPPEWTKKMTFVMKIKGHSFYRELN